jgi:hypothetical protein
MIDFDRVYCDLCECHIGQIFNQSCDSGALPLLSIAPHFAVCPDCYDASELVEFSANRADAQQLSEVFTC